MGLLEQLKIQQPIAVPFFLQALTSGTLSHGYILKGRCLDTMMGVALEIAKQLNCQTPLSPTEPCNNCPSCHWVNQNSHPTVLTISRLTFLTGENGQDLDEQGLIKLAKKQTQATQIKTDQIERLLKMLSISSPYTRIIIFTDAEEMTKHEGEDASAGYFPPPSEWRVVPGREKKQLVWRPLERRHFNAASANRFLKTLEEPPKRTVFFFLTDSEQNIMETLVSRCQVVPFQTETEKEALHNKLPQQHEVFLKQFCNALATQKDIYALSEVFEEHFVETSDETLEQGLGHFQTFLRNNFVHDDVPEETVFNRYRHQIKALEDALKRLQSKTNANQTLNSLIYQLQKV